MLKAFKGREGQEKVIITGHGRNRSSEVTYGREAGGGNRLYIMKRIGPYKTWEEMRTQEAMQEIDHTWSRKG